MRSPDQWPHEPFSPLVDVRARRTSFISWNRSWRSAFSLFAPINKVTSKTGFPRDLRVSRVTPVGPVRIGTR